MRIVAATQNSHKIREMEAITADFGMEILSQQEAGLPVLDIEENGTTFEENSAIKARTICSMSGLPAIADDSGLSVDALDGAPGIFSARYAGPEADDQANNAKLLEALRAVPETERTGRYVSVITLAYPDGRLLSARGECTGILLTAPRGAGGFGYDPLFVPDGTNTTFAEMTAELKNQISHRARALARLRELLEENET
ncbi:MAG: XTP/dITP diphosphatase [Eubacteriales bacterium]|jgi:XTP/dITP diphosphohydrolase|nr:XTP/dITP diphosphatase [Eubacteriales bacterium]MDD3290324.1 XTP/dITP diphosphatase [Eubacteriales bacterium]